MTEKASFEFHTFTSKLIIYMKLVCGKSLHPQTQGSVERANGDITDMLIAWMVDNESQDWTTGIKFIHFPKYCAHHSCVHRLHLRLVVKLGLD